MEEFFHYLQDKINYTREILVLCLILGRVLPMIFMVPFFGGQQAPPETKMSISVLFAIVLWPLVHDSMTADIPLEAFAFLLLLLKETLIGFVIGFVMMHIFYAMDAAGRFIDTARGAAMSQMLMPQLHTQVTPLGTFYSQLLLVFFMAMGGLDIFLDTFFMSFASIPINEGIDLTSSFSPLVDYILHVTSDSLMIAVLLAAPSVAATFITDLVFGILNRAAPQLNAYFMAMPIKAAGALALLLAAFGPILSRFGDFIEAGLLAVQKTLALMMHG